LRGGWRRKGAGDGEGLEEERAGEGEVPEKERSRRWRKAGSGEKWALGEK
jgi:hypothetical protein